MYIVTGGAGLIGSAMIWELNRNGIGKILEWGEFYGTVRF